MACTFCVLELKTFLLTSLCKRTFSKTIFCFRGSKPFAANIKKSSALIRGMQNTKMDNERNHAPKKKIKKQWSINNMAPLSPVGVSNKLQPNPANQKRAKILSIVLFDYISSLIHPGTLRSDLVDMGVTISKVVVPPSLSVINVHWIASGIREKDQVTQEVLDSVIQDLRKALMGYRVMGNLPPLNFVKDLSDANYTVIEDLLKVADMGPDFVPTCLGEYMKSDIVLKREETFTWNGSLKSEIASTKDNKITSDNVKNVELVSNIYGLNHSELMQKVTESTVNAAKNRSDNPEYASVMQNTFNSFNIKDLENLMAVKKKNRKSLGNVLSLDDIEHQVAREALHTKQKDDMFSEDEHYVSSDEFEHENDDYTDIHK